MITKFYKWMAAGTVTSLLLATLAVAPVSAQSSSGNGQGSDQNQGQGMNQGNNQNSNGQNENNGQNQGQGSCATFAQSMGQGMSQGNSQNGNGQNGNNGQAALGTGPGNAATPMANCWLSIGPGQKQWYKFHVGARSNKGDENNNFDNANGVDDSDAAIAQLTMDTQGCIAFEIWTQERLNAAQSGVKDNDKLLGPVGAGSPEFAINHNNDNSSDDNSSSNNNSNSDKNLNRSRLLWRGGSTVREDFLLVVRNLRSDFACSYRLSVAGPTVSFPSANNGGNNAANGNNNGNNGSNNSNGNNGGNNNNNNGDNSRNNGSNNNGGSNSNNNNG